MRTWQSIFFIALVCTLACDSKPTTTTTMAVVQPDKDGVIRNRPLDKAGTLPLESLKLPAGFKIDIYARVPNARSLARGDKGTLFIGNRSGNKVYAVVDTDGDNVADKQYTIASGLHMPNGVAFRNGALYVAEVSRIWRYDNIEANLATPPKPVLISDKFPTDDHHGWKYIAFGPDGKLYVPVGAPCNICEHKEKPIYASISRMNPDGTGLEVYANGVRNSVGFTWHPDSKDLWFTDNGRDLLGDDLPPDELNMAFKAGQHFGYPYCHGGYSLDPEYGKGRKCEEFSAPAQRLLPHSAALGLKFYTGSMFPADYKHDIFIAHHGSWNRTTPQGYYISRVKLSGDKVIKYEPFISGWLRQTGSGLRAWGRPVDVLVMPDGALLISDDQADCVYRVSYAG